MLLLPLNKLCDYTSATPSTRNMIEGERVINSGFVIICGTTFKSTVRIDLFSLCLRTSGLTSEPHTITGQLTVNCNDNNGSEMDKVVTVKVMNCSCKAGTSHCCKHVVAVLLFCNRKDLEKLDALSSTDTKCLWKIHQQPVLEQYEAQPVRTFCCVKMNRLPPLSQSILAELRLNFIACDPETAIAKSSTRKRKSSQIDNPLEFASKVLRLSVDNNNNISQNTNNKSVETDNVNQRSAIQFTVQTTNPTDDFLLKLIENAEKSAVLVALGNITFTIPKCCQNVYEAIHCEDISKAANDTHFNKYNWKKERQFRITGSRCYEIYTYAKNDWTDKARRYFWPREITTPAMHHGTTFEPVARDVYRDQTKAYVRETGLIVSKHEPWLAYSPDGIVVKNEKPFRLLEIKCPVNLPNTETKSLLEKCKKYVKKIGNELKLKEKHMYYAQIQFGMCLLNLRSCDFIIYSNISNTIRVITVDFDIKYAEELMSVLKTKYFTKMIHTICTYSKNDKFSSKTSLLTVR